MLAAMYLPEGSEAIEFIVFSFPNVSAWESPDADFAILMLPPSPTVARSSPSSLKRDYFACSASMGREDIRRPEGTPQVVSAPPSSKLRSAVPSGVKASDIIRFPEPPRAA
jgi:hypothetical protein